MLEREFDFEVHLDEMHENHYVSIFLICDYQFDRHKYRINQINGNLILKELRRDPTGWRSHDGTFTMKVSHLKAKVQSKFSRHILLSPNHVISKCFLGTS